jgi:hypothetical protein
MKCEESDYGKIRVSMAGGELTALDVARTFVSTPLAVSVESVTVCSDSDIRCRDLQCADGRSVRCFSFFYPRTYIR